MMELRHAAALAFVSWYLIFPPIDPKSRYGPSVSQQQFDQQAPMEEWWVADSFATSDLCQAAIASMKMKPNDSWNGQFRCISADDPRVKGKKLHFVPGKD